jgi:hypothetical protein
MFQDEVYKGENDSQSPATREWQPITGNQRMTANHRQPENDSQSPTTGEWQPITGNQSVEVINCKDGYWYKKYFEITDL